MAAASVFLNFDVDEDLLAKEVAEIIADGTGRPLQKIMVSVQKVEIQQGLANDTFKTKERKNPYDRNYRAITKEETKIPTMATFLSSNITSYLPRKKNPENSNKFSFPEDECSHISRSNSNNNSDKNSNYQSSENSSSNIFGNQDYSKFSLNQDLIPSPKEIKESLLGESALLPLNFLKNGPRSSLNASKRSSSNMKVNTPSLLHFNDNNSNEKTPNSSKNEMNISVSLEPNPDKTNNKSIQCASSRTFNKKDEKNIQNSNYFAGRDSPLRLEQIGSYQEFNERQDLSSSEETDCDIENKAIWINAIIYGANEDHHRLEKLCNYMHSKLLTLLDIPIGGLQCNLKYADGTEFRYSDSQNKRVGK